jgi:membrane protease subunit (stomatin/prohibitin family)
MAIIDRVKFDSPIDSVLVWKYPSEELSIGTQLIVNQSQEAVFVKGGQVVDIFSAGTHTLSTGNLPLLNKIVNFPFGGKTPFTAEVWYVNKTVKRDMKWGTPGGIQIFDAATNYPVTVRSFGKWGFRVNDSRSFVMQLMGTQLLAMADKIDEYFIGEIIQRLSTAISKCCVEQNTPIFHIAAKINDISKFLEADISPEFDRFGIELVNFNIENIGIPPEEMQKLQEIFAKKAEVSALGQSYQMVKTFETLEKAAGNEGAAGGLLAGGLGLGMGLGGGMVAGQQLAQNINVQQPAPAPSSTDDPVARLGKLKSLLENGLISKEDFEKTKAEILASL